ncbi:MAG TPA: hypothetical protein VFX50_16285 [Gemmatimonadales bacterium]|nr:hypothetical protein [Gemmatimonadales bacterium]
MFESLKARLERLFAEATPAADRREEAASLREALVDMRAAVAGMRDGLAATERELAAQRQALADAERRGALAQAIGDAETAEVAGRFVARHQEHAEVLARKADVQRQELAIAEREMEELAARLRTAPSVDAASDSVRQAWRDLEAAGGTRPDTDPADALLTAELDRARRAAAVEEQLAYLKKKLGKE